MPVKTFRVVTDKGTYDVQVEMGEDSPSPGLGQGRMEAMQPPQSDEPRQEGFMDRLGRNMFEGAAAPTNLKDLVGLAIPGTPKFGNAAGEAAVGALRSMTPGPKTGRALELVGKNLPTLSNPLKPASAAMQGVGRWLQKPSGQGVLRTTIASEAQATRALDPAAELAKRLGTPTDEEMQALLRAQQYKSGPR